MPPLTALRCFEAAARRLSFKDAADELSVTPAAVSQQIRALEDIVGQPLFIRRTRAIELTDAGREALPLLTAAFDQIERAAIAMRRRTDRQVVTVSVSPSFCTIWLVPRLASFNARHPEIDLRLDASDRMANFTTDGTDVGIRYGNGDYPGLERDLLQTAEVFPVCAPALLQGAHPLKRPEDLAHHTLLHSRWTILQSAAPSWGMWLKTREIEGVDPTRGPQFSLDELVLRAAVSGQGVALANMSLAQDDLASGALVKPFPDLAADATGFAYYLTYPAAKLDRPQVAAFRDWILREAWGAA